MSGLTSAPSSARFGVFELDLQTGELRKSGVLLRLAPQPFKILALLTSRPGQLLTREEIRGQIWGADTFVDFEHGLNAAIKTIRDTLDDDAETPRYIETLPRRGYRFIAPVERVATRGEPRTPIPGPPRSPDTTSGIEVTKKATLFRWVAVSGAAILVIGLAVAGWRWHSRQAHVLTENETIVFADFDNTTGDPVFDGTLRQGLTVQFKQSPFFGIVSGDRIAETLRMMEKPPNTPLAQGVAREVCQRANATAVIEGSISALGSQYVLNLNAVNCRTGEIMAAEQAVADGKGKVLPALGKAATQLRSKLGEPRASLEAHDVPLEQATTSSLEALQAFSRGAQAFWNFDMPDAASFYQRAVTLDPSFASAYALLGTTQAIVGDGRAAENNKKAYELRDRVSESENLGISRNYHLYVTGNFDKALQVTQQWGQAYPHDPASIPVALAACYQALGRYDEALTTSLEAVQTNPTVTSNVALAASYYLLNRLDEARATIQRARASHLDSPVFSKMLWRIAYFQNDQASMAANEAAARRAGDIIDLILPWEEGRLSRLRDGVQRAVPSAMRSNQTEVAAGIEADVALSDALAGNLAEARAEAMKTIQIAGDSSDWSSFGRAGLTLALAGGSAETEKLAADLSRRFPQATYIQSYFLPAIRAAVALRHGKPEDAAERLNATLPYDSMERTDLMAIYLRGQAFLDMHQGTLAAGEFQKIIDHPVLSWTNVALAHLGLARAYALQDDTAKARAAYQDFLALWKDADPDIPILKQAKAEYAKLK